MSENVDGVLWEMVAACESLGIEHAVMGGLAVRVHGIPRPTYDIDLAISVDAEQLVKLFSEVESRGFTVSEAYRSGWRDEVGGMPLVKCKTYLDVGHTVDVDIFLSETEFLSSVMSRRLELPFGSRALNMVSPEDLVLLKLLANRPRDYGDIADVLFIQGQLDEAYMATWAESLGVLDRLQRVLSEA